MAKFIHKVTGVVVSVDEATASSLGGEWVPQEAAPVEKPAPKRTSRSKPTAAK